MILSIRCLSIYEIMPKWKGYAIFETEYKLWTWIVYANCFYNFKKPHHHSYSFHFANYFVFLHTQFSGKRGKLPRYLHTSFSTPLVSVIYYCPWNLSYKHANTNDMAGLPNWWTFFINIIFVINFLKKFIKTVAESLYQYRRRNILDVWYCIS